MSCTPLCTDYISVFMSIRDKYRNVDRQSMIYGICGQSRLECKANKMTVRALSSIGLVLCLLISFIGLNECATPSVPKRKLNDGNEMPAIALGTWLGLDKQGNRVKAKGHEIAQAVEWALEAGYNHVDTARIYGIEPQVGNGLNNVFNKGQISRNDVYVTTKLWNDRHGKDNVVPALRESLENLRLDYVDMYLIHWPCPMTSDGQPLDIDLLDTWAGMEEAKRLGLTKSIGVSNFNRTQLARLIEQAAIKPAALQIEINPNLIQKPLVSYAQEQGLVVMAYTPFGSLLPSKARDDAPPPRIDDPTLVSIADKYKKTVPQVILRYLLQRDLVILPKSVTKRRIEENLNILDFELTAEETQQIEAFDKNYRVVDALKLANHPQFPFKA